MPGLQSVPGLPSVPGPQAVPGAGMPLPRLVAVPNWAAPDDGACEGARLAAHPPGRRERHPGTAIEPPPDGQPADWPQRFARMVTEALAGSRPERQVLPWTSKRARSQFHRLRAGFRGDGRQPRVMRVVATWPTPDAIEMSVIAWFGQRTRAFALRLERLPPQDRARLASARRLPWPDAVTTASGGWICTDIEAA